MSEEHPDLDDIAYECVARFESEGEAALDRACESHPELADRLRNLVGRLQRTGLIEGPASAASFEFGDYHVLRRIGGGGMGVVYLAEQKSLGRRVALKLMRPGFHRDEKTRERFRREIESISKLEHPGICPVYEAGDVDGTPYLAMRFIDGESLAEVLERIRLDEPVSSDGHTPTPIRAGRDLMQFVRLGEKVARALHAAHEHGLVHRDVKPANIMIDQAGEPVLLDFGLALPEDTGQPQLTASSERLGTPAYMAPEQITGADVDGRTDVYGLGVTLYECLTLRCPFEAGSREALYREILTATPMSAHVVQRAIPKDLSLVVETAMAKLPQERYATAAAFADDLARVSRFQPITARRPPLLLRARRWTQRHPVATTAFALLGSALIVTLVLLMQLLRSLEAYARERDVSLAEKLLREAKTELWPPHPDRIPLMDEWLGEARELVPRRKTHLATLEQLRERALGSSETVKEALAELDGIKTRLERLKSAAAANKASGVVDPKVRPEARVAKTRQNQLVDLLRDQQWRFADYEDQFLHDRLRDLIETIDGFARTNGVIEQVTRRRKLATAIERMNRDDNPQWQAAIAEVAETEAYAGMQPLTPQLGLRPLGADPVSKLQEFAVLGTGKVPQRDEKNGTLKIGAGSALVLVLLPPGRFWMGAQSQDLDGQNYDKGAVANESPVRDVKLDAFFLSKYEMTQGQWIRVMGSNPSRFDPSFKGNSRRVTLRHPVESVTWHDCVEATRRFGLRLPTEAQWEYGTRAGKSTPWWTGDDPASLQDAERLADFDHGYRWHAPVGLFRPNAFGLHDVVGNVREWCHDSHLPNGEDGEPRAGDGLRRDAHLEPRARRGAGWSLGVQCARSAFRAWLEPDGHGHNQGLRPARALTTEGSHK